VTLVDGQLCVIGGAGMPSTHPISWANAAPLIVNATAATASGADKNIATLVMKASCFDLDHGQVNALVILGQPSSVLPRCA
jgi:hypothetical protein